MESVNWIGNNRNSCAKEHMQLIGAHGTAYNSGPRRAPEPNPEQEQLLRYQTGLRRRLLGIPEPLAAFAALLSVGTAGKPSAIGNTGTVGGQRSSGLTMATIKPYR